MTRTDEWLCNLDFALRTLGGNAFAQRPVPPAPMCALSDAERTEAGALMRVNHVGEICAQALYQAQALTARTPQVRELMADAAREETDHLAWTQERLKELGAHRSWLNPLWYGGAFALGLLAGRLGDKTSLAFVVETERQVEEHLLGHLQRLPEADARSRAIVAQMALDERNHADRAEQAGALPMPAPVRWLMRAAAKLMTTTAHRI